MSDVIESGAPVRRAIVCDDDPMIALIAGELLSEAGVEVVLTAGSGAELRATLAGTIPDIVVLDHILPDASSDELVAAVAAAAPRCRIILFSARNDPDIGQDPHLFARVPKQGTSKLYDAIEAAVQSLAADP